MANARDIKRRMKAVGNISRITKTMQMIATSKFARAQHDAVASKPYSEGIFELVTQLAAKAGNIQHPLISGPTGGAKGPQLILMITSDRGLCGPYNGSIIRRSMKLIRDTPADARQVEVVGKKGAGVLRFNKIEVKHHHLEFGDKPKFDDVERLATRYMNEFAKGEISGVKVVYMRYISTARQMPEMLQLLPLKPPPRSTDGESNGSGPVSFDFSPEPEVLLDDLLPVTVKTTLFQAFNDAVVSEHVSRMIAMKSATDNAEKMGKNLKRKFNRARQTQITPELIEIVGGAAALE